MNATLPPLADRLAAARRETLALVALVEDADLNRSLNPEFSPLRWHLGHIAVFESFWVLARAGGQEGLRPDFDRLFDPTRNPKAERVLLPPRSEILDYAERVRERSLAVLAPAAPDHPAELLRDGYVGELVYEHECQHQEIMTFLLQMIPSDQKRRPDGWTPGRAGTEPGGDPVRVAGGPFRMGTTGRGFAYDNEREAHEVELADFAIDRAPVTEAAFVRFLEAGGYRDKRPWSAEGWRWRCEQGVESPRDWSSAEGGGWRIRGMFEVREPLAGVPVVGVSHHEAAAYAHWLGRRLPTEAEWERCAAWDDRTGRARLFPWGDDPPRPDLANTDGLCWGTRPVGPGGRSPAGCDDLTGQVWEWTSSTFGPYPGFRPFPYEGYSQTWFDGRHRVLRGGSWATRGPLCRSSFRNWYEPHVREILAGFRCAREGG